MYISAYLDDVLKQLLTHSREIAIFGSNATSREIGRLKTSFDNYGWVTPSHCCSLKFSGTHWCCCCCRPRRHGSETQSINGKFKVFKTADNSFKGIERSMNPKVRGRRIALDISSLIYDVTELALKPANRIARLKESPPQ